MAGNKMSLCACRAKINVVCIGNLPLFVSRCEDKQQLLLLLS